MDDEERYEPGRQGGGRRLRWSWRRRLFMGVAVMVVALGLPAWVLHSAAQVRHQSEIDLIREAGEPLTFEDLNALREPIPDDQNMALRIVPLFDSLQMEESAAPALPIVGKSRKTQAALGQRHNAEMLDAMKAFLALHQDTLAQLHAAARLERGVFPIDWAADGISTTYAHHAPLRGAAKLLALEARVCADRGDLNGAMESCLAVFRMAACVREEPNLFGFLSGIAIDSLGIDALQGVLAVGEPDTVWIDRIQAEVEPWRDQHGLVQRALFGERVMGLACFSSVRAGAIQPGHSSELGEVAQVTRNVPKLLDLNEQKYLRLMRLQCEAAAMPFKDCVQRLRSLEEESSELSLLYVLASILDTQVVRATELFVKTRAQIRAAVAGLEVEKFRRAHGRWPATLEEVFGDDPAGMPLDPFNDDAPMRYVVDEAGCTIYSFSEDEKDDGGVTEPVDGKRAPDVGFRLLSPHLRGATVTTQPVDKEVWEAIEALRAAATQPAATAPVR